MDRHRVPARRARARLHRPRLRRLGLRPPADSARPRDRRRTRGLRGIDRSVAGRHRDRAQRRRHPGARHGGRHVLGDRDDREWWGLGQARALAADLRTLPAVVLDTQERLYPGNDAITLRELGAAASPDAGADADADAQPEAQTYGYRYFGLRLLAQGGGRLYLVPLDEMP